MTLWLIFSCLLWSPHSAAAPLLIEIEELDLGLHLAADPSASKKIACVVSLEKDSGGTGFDTVEEVPAGKYRATLRVRSPKLHLPLVDATKVSLAVSAGEEQLSTVSCGRLSFSTPDEYAEVSLQFVLEKPSSLSFSLHWIRDAASTAIATARNAPTLPKDGTLGAGKDEEELDSGVIELELNEIKYACLLLDRLSIQRIGADVFIERVWPQKVHIAPGEENPIEVTLRNVGGQKREVALELRVLGGLQETQPAILPERRRVSLMPGKTTVRFDWTARQRFGHEARVELFAGDELVDRASEYFGVSKNVWEISLQAPGFLEWVWGQRTRFIEDMVERDRAAYMNVVEAFSWAPCSFSDLTPSEEEWWTGQNAYHQVLEEGKRWFRLAKQNGLKMITYSWPAASGPIGMEFARKNPGWISNQEIGLGLSFNVRDLRFRRWANDSGKPFLAAVSRQWHSGSIDRGQLSAINYGANEIARSAKMLGWDGVRFDMPWTWSAMGGKGVHSEFDTLGINEEIKQLLPDLYGKQDTWSGDEVSLRNLRWTKHTISKQFPDFVYSYNWGVPFIKEDNQGRQQTSRAYAEACAGGGQIMDEAIRHWAGPWKDYADRILRESDYVRNLGGHFEVVGMSTEGLTELDRIYMKIFTLAGRAHPYIGTYQWGNSPTGTYSQFATRFSELLWHEDWKTLPEPEKHFAVSSVYPIWWQKHVCIRQVDGRTSILLHLIAAPPTEKPFQLAKTLPPEQKDVRVTFKEFEGLKPGRVLACTAEPETRTLEVALKKVGEVFEVTIPEHHYWTVLMLEFRD
ncbi:MAG: hypothetical protein O2857_13460 [Planctomycetota bacterium]|nr:hypothetical protein [Planctomycetota bacterium]